MGFQNQIYLAGVYITTPGINLEEWIRNPNKHGLPKPDISSGNLYYWCPTDERVARLCAVTYWANLNCNRDPSNLNGGFGITPHQDYSKCTIIYALMKIFFLRI